MKIQFKMCTFETYFVQCLLLLKTVTYAIPVSQEDSELELTTIIPNIETRNVFTNLSESHTTEREIPVVENDNDERFDVMDAFKDIDVNFYKEIDEDGQFKTLCWAELLILTENNKYKNMTLSREFSIVLESPGNIPKENLAEDEIIPYELVEGNTKKSRIMNFTTISKTEEFTVREHRTLFCGGGPILTREYSEWPKLNKRRLEIRLTPTTPTVWRVCRKNVLSTTDCNSTFDTTATNEILGATKRTTESSTRPYISEKVKNKRNKIKIKSTKSITFLTESNETSILNKFADMPHDLEYKSHSSDTENLQLSLDHLNNTEEVLQQPEVESEVELLRRNMYFKKFTADGEENMNDSITAENNFNPLDNTILFDLIFPDKKVLTSLYNAEVKNKFLIKIKIDLEHRAPNPANGQETTDYLIGLEEDSVYHTVPNSPHL